MIAHQYKIRKEKELIEVLSFNKEDVSLNSSEIRIIDKSTAKSLIIEYEWLKTMPLVSNFHFGIYFKVNNMEYLGGVLVYSTDYAENTGVWDKYGFNNKMILLSRGVCLWWTPKNTASYFISKSIKWLKTNTKYRIVSATVDPMAGEIGTIYQALNWHYVGLMSGNYNAKDKELKRFSVLINGKLRYSRSIRKELGTMRKDVILNKYPDAVFIPQYRKRRYFYFFDTKNENLKYYENIKHLILNYPKRNNDEIIGIIYKITNTINMKTYIGQTTRPLKDRINDYIKGYGNDYLNNSIKKHGFSNFKFETIDTANTINELNEKEISWIKFYDSTNKEKGYNIESGGLNSIPSIETRDKMSRSHKGIKQTNNWITKRIAVAGTIDAKKYGKPKTEEEKKYLSENSPKFWLNKNRDEETKKKISETKKQQHTLPPNSKKVEKYLILNGETIKIYNSTYEAATNNLLYSQSKISRICNNKAKSKEDFSFRFTS
jgi:group I intron endonuclease